jgi:hypothetical protein
LISTPACFPSINADRRIKTSATGGDSEDKKAEENRFKKQRMVVGRSEEVWNVASRRDKKIDQAFARHSETAQCLEVKLNLKDLKDLKDLFVEHVS